MADKVKSQKDKYLDLLEQAYDNAGSKSGINLSTDEIDELFTDLSNTDPTKLNQWLVLNKDKLENIPEIALQPAFISVTEDPKVVDKDYGFTESDDYYKMEGPKSWMNKSYAYLKNNADKYGLSVGDYLNKVAELSTKKEQEQQWKDNASIAKFNVPVLGEIAIPGLTRSMLPTSFNKAAMGKDVNKGDIAFDIGTDVVEGGMAATPYKLISGPVQAALLGNTARQVKGLNDNTQQEFSGLDLAGAGAMGAFTRGLSSKAAGDALKRIPVLKESKKVTDLANRIEDLGNVDPQLTLRETADEMTRLERLGQSLSNLRKEAEIPEGKNLRVSPKQNSSTYAEITNNNKDNLFRQALEGRLPSEEAGKQAHYWMDEYRKGQVPQSLTRAKKLSEMNKGDVLLRAWSEPRLMRVLRKEIDRFGGVSGGRFGTNISEDDKKAIAKEIINSTEWGKYITGLPHNLSEEEIYLGTVYGE